MLILKMFHQQGERFKVIILIFRSPIEHCQTLGNLLRILELKQIDNRTKRSKFAKFLEGLGQPSNHLAIRASAYEFSLPFRR